MTIFSKKYFITSQSSKFTIYNAYLVQNSFVRFPYIFYFSRTMNNGKMAYFRLKRYFFRRSF